MWCIAHLLWRNCTTSNPSNLQVVSITGHFTGEPGSLSEFDQAFCGCYQLVINHRPLTSTGGAKLQNQGQPKRYRFLPTQWAWTAWGKTPTSFMWRIKTFKAAIFLRVSNHDLAETMSNYVQFTCWMYLIITHFISFPLWSCCVWGNFNWHGRDT